MDYPVEVLSRIDQQKQLQPVVGDTPSEEAPEDLASSTDFGSVAVGSIDRRQRGVAGLGRFAITRT